MVELKIMKLAMVEAKIVELAMVEVVTKLIVVAESLYAIAHYLMAIVDDPIL